MKAIYAYAGTWQSDRGVLGCMQADATIAELEGQAQQLQLQYAREAGALQQVRVELVEEQRRAQDTIAALRASMESATADAVAMEQRRFARLLTTSGSRLTSPCSMAFLSACAPSFFCKV